MKSFIELIFTAIIINITLGVFPCFAQSTPTLSSDGLLKEALIAPSDSPPMSAALPQCKYKATRIGGASDFDQTTWASSINDGGIASGQSNSASFGPAMYFAADGSEGQPPEVLLFPGQGINTPYLGSAINNTGKIAFTRKLAASADPQRAWVWDHGASASIHSFPDPTGTSQALSINDNGWVTGWVRSSGTAPTVGFVYRPNAQGQWAMDTFNNGYIYISAINNNNNFIGHVGIGTGGNPQRVSFGDTANAANNALLPIFPCNASGDYCGSAEGMDINDNDVVVGSAYVVSGHQPARKEAIEWLRTNGVWTLVTLSSQQYLQNEATAINNAGLIIGNACPSLSYCEYTPGSPNLNRPMVFADGITIELAPFITSGPDYPYQLTRALGINNQNEILVNGRVGTVSASFKLTPDGVSWPNCTFATPSLPTPTPTFTPTGTPTIMQTRAPAPTIGTTSPRLQIPTPAPTGIATIDDGTIMGCAFPDCNPPSVLKCTQRVCHNGCGYSCVKPIQPPNKTIVNDSAKQLRPKKKKIRLKSSQKAAEQSK